MREENTTPGEVLTAVSGTKATYSSEMDDDSCPRAREYRAEAKRYKLACEELESRVEILRARLDSSGPSREWYSVSGVVYWRGVGSRWVQVDASIPSGTRVKVLYPKEKP